MAYAGKVLRKRLLEHADRFTSKRQMADMIGVAPETLTRWLRPDGLPNPRLDELEEIGSSLGLTLGELLTDAASPKPTPRPATSTVDPRISRALKKLLDSYDEVAKLATELLHGRGDQGKR